MKVVLIQSTRDRAHLAELHKDVARGPSSETDRLLDHVDATTDQADARLRQLIALTEFELARARKLRNSRSAAPVAGRRAAPAQGTART